MRKTFNNQLTDFLYDYYESVCGDDNFSLELTKDLASRNDLLSKIQAILKNQVNLNPTDYDTPLMASVMHFDAAMTEFLIENGADINFCGYAEDDTEDNYYLDDLDIRYLNNYKDKAITDAIIATAKAIVLKGGYNKNYYGLCLAIDIEERQITLSPPEFKY